MPTPLSIEGGEKGLKVFFLKIHYIYTNDVQLSKQNEHEVFGNHLGISSVSILAEAVCAGLSKVGEGSQS